MKETGGSIDGRGHLWRPYIGNLLVWRYQWGGRLWRSVILLYRWLPLSSVMIPDVIWLLMIITNWCSACSILRYCSRITFLHSAPVTMPCYSHQPVDLLPVHPCCDLRLPYPCYRILLDCIILNCDLFSPWLPHIDSLMTLSSFLCHELMTFWYIPHSDDVDILFKLMGVLITCAMTLCLTLFIIAGCMLLPWLLAYLRHYYKVGVPMRPYDPWW